MSYTSVQYVMSHNPNNLCEWNGLGNIHKPWGGLIFLTFFTHFGGRGNHLVSTYVFIYYFTCAPFLKTLHCNSITVFRQSSKMADILSLILDWQVHCNFEPTCLLLPTYIFPILIDEFRQTQVSRYTYLLTPQDYFEGVSISEFVNYYHHQLINISIDSWKTTKY